MTTAAVFRVALVEERATTIMGFFYNQTTKRKEGGRPPKKAKGQGARRKGESFFFRLWFRLSFFPFWVSFFGKKCWSSSSSVSSSLFVISSKKVHRRRPRKRTKHHRSLSLPLSFSFSFSFSLSLSLSLSLAMTSGALLAAGHRFCRYHALWSRGGRRQNRRCDDRDRARAFSEKSTSSSGRRAAALEDDGIETIGSSREGGEVIVALGKFDAMHRGHKALAFAAATLSKDESNERESTINQQAVLLSFENMAEVLGWKPRKPVTAKRDRERVLKEWSKELGVSGGAESRSDKYSIREHGVPFASIREMSPECFVKTLKERLGVAGVVAGENYRFGYRASGSADDLVAFGKKYGLRVKIVSLLDADKLGAEACDSDDCKGEQVSSSRVRACLKFGDVDAVTKLLGRKHRLCLEKIIADDREVGTIMTDDDENFVAYKSENITPKAGDYEGFLIVSSSDDNSPREERAPVRCKIVKNGEVDGEEDEDDGYVLVPESAFSPSINDTSRALAFDIERRV